MPRPTLCCPSTEKSLYKNRTLQIIFPLIFFCTLLGVTFMLWPLEDNPESEITILFIIGVVLTGIAGVATIFSIIYTCYLHVRSFDSRRLPYLTIDYSKPAQASNSKESIQRIISPSRVVPELNVSPPAAPPTHQATSHTIQEETPTEEHDRQNMLPPVTKQSLSGVDNPATTVTADVHRSMSMDSERSPSPAVQVTYSRRDIPVGKLPSLAPGLAEEGYNTKL